MFAWSPHCCLARNVTIGVKSKRYYLGSTLVATGVGGTLSYLHADYLRSTVGASNAASVEYTPYGLVRTSQGTLPTDRQFQGQQNQAGIGLYHMGARWYDPTIGLWTQPDTTVPSAADPLALNRYAFVEGNPLRYRDPSGQAGVGAWGAALGAAFELAPEAYAGAVAAYGALTVAVGQHRQEIAAAANDAVAAVQGVDVNILFTDPATGKPRWIPQIPSLDKKLGGTSNDQKDAHHLIPQELAKNPVVRKARAQGWQINGKDNGILLPDETVDPKNATLPVHNSGHSQWNKHVQGLLDDIGRRAEDEGWSDADPRWREAVEELDRQLRDEITDPDQHPPGEPLS